MTSNLYSQFHSLYWMGIVHIIIIWFFYIIYHIPCRTYVENEYVILGLGTRGNFGTYLPEGAYKSKKTNLFSGAAAFHLPTASPLKASNFPEIFQKLFISSIIYLERLQRGNWMVVRHWDLFQDGK